MSPGLDVRCAALLLLLPAAACTMRPSGERAERERAAAQGAVYARALAERKRPALRPDAPLADYLAHALACNGEVEAAWHRWLEALEEVPQAATQDSTAMLGIEHELDGGSALDRTALSLMTDTMNNLMLPGRLEARGEAALRRARARAAEFDRTRLQLQTTVATAYHALARTDRDIALQDGLRAVLALQVQSLAARVQAGAAMQGELLQASLALDRIDAELAELRGSRPARLAALRAAIGAGPEFHTAAPALADLAPLQEPEHAFLERALQRSPELEVRRREHEAALAAITVAEWERMPMFSLRGLVMGDGAGFLAGALTLPFLRGTAIEAGVRQARAAANAAAAMRRQAAHDAIAEVLAELAMLDAIEREAAILQQRALPKLQQMAAIARASWSAGQGQFAEYTAARAMQTEIERRLAALAEAHATGRARLQQAAGQQLVE